MTSPIFQNVFLQDSQSQALEDYFHQLLLTSKPAKSGFEGNECLDQTVLENFWCSIKETSSKEELKHRLLAFYEDCEEKTEKEMLILLEVLEYLFSKSSNKNLVKVLGEDATLGFLKYAVSSEATEVVRRRTVYLMSLIAQKIKPLPEFSAILELKSTVEKDLGLKYEGTLNSRYFLNPTDKYPSSPGKQTFFPDNPSNPNLIFENVFSNQKENFERSRPEKIETRKIIDVDLNANFQNLSLGNGNNGYPFTGGNNGLGFSSENHPMFNQVDIHLDPKRFLTGSNDSNVNSTGDSLGGYQYKATMPENSKNYFEQFGTTQMHPNNYGYEQPTQNQYPNTWMKGGDPYTVMSPTLLEQRSSPKPERLMNLRVNTTKITESPIMSPTKIWAQNQQIDSPIMINSPLGLASSPTLQDSNRHILEQLEMKYLTKGILQLEELLEFKRLNCQKPNCPLRSFIVTQKQFMCENDMYACPFYHNHGDRRRYPLHKNNLAKSFYVHDKLCEDCFNDPNKHKGRCYYCKNWFELFYHPKNYKLVPCTNRYCDKKPNFCPFYHHINEKLEWDAILMNSFQYDRRNIIFSAEILRNQASQQQQQQSPNKINLLGTKINSNNYQSSPIQSPMQYRQTQQPQSPYYSQNFQQSQSPYLQNQQGFQLPQQQQQPQVQLLNLKPLQQQQQSNQMYSPQYPRPNLIDYQQQNTSSPQNWGGESYGNFSTAETQYNQDQFEKKAVWSPNTYQTKKSPLNPISQPFSGNNSTNHIKQLFSGPSSNTGPQQLNSNNQGGSPLLNYQANNSSLLQLQSLSGQSKFNDFNEDAIRNHIQRNLDFFDLDLVEISEKESLILNKPLRSGILNEDNKVLEFVSCKGPTLTDIQKEELLRSICGFLNGSGGQVYIGVNDEGKVVGVSMNNKEYQAFKEDIVNSLLDCFSPPVDDSSYTIKRFYVLESPKQQINQNSWKNIVIEITIKANEKVYFLKEYGKQLCYHRFDGSTRALQGDQINELFKKKMGIL